MQVLLFGGLGDGAGGSRWGGGGRVPGPESAGSPVSPPRSRRAPRPLISLPRFLKACFAASVGGGRRVRPIRSLAWSISSAYVSDDATDSFGAMNLRHMEVFHAIMRTGSGTGAARSRHVTQPAVSALVEHFEKQPQLKLFH